MNYQERIDALRAVKEQQTREKYEKNSYMNEDDYGSVLPTEDVQMNIEFNDKENSTFYGADLWAKNFTEVMMKHPVYVDSRDALAGRWMYILQRLRPFESAVSSKNLEMAPVFDYSRLKPIHEKYNIIPGIGKMHHFAPDYQIGLELGFGGLRDKVEKYSKIHPEAKELYDAEKMVLGGIRNWMERTLQEIRRKESAETDPELRENLHEMAEANANIIDGVPKTFREVCQWIAWVNMCNRTYDRAGAGCQLDVLLYPYYEKDKAEGRIDAEKAKYIIACLLLVDTHYYQIGGPDANGEDMTNELSFIILEAAHMLKTSINLTIGVHDKLDPELFRRGVEILTEDRKAYPRFVGSDSVIDGFMKNGYSRELAVKRIAVGCNWMSLPGMEYTMNDLIKINLAKVMEVALDEYMAEPCEKRTTEELYGVFLRHLQAAIDCVKEGVDFHLKNQYKNAPELILNLLTHGPIERGLDVSNGGVDLYNIAVDGSALATTADSFAALQKFIEKEGRLTWDSCYKALQDNFETPEGALIQTMLRHGDRYGSGNSLGDEWAVRISRDFTAMIKKDRTPDGHMMIPGLFSWANTVSMGYEVGATANGRKKGEPISHGANPHPGFRKDGALTAISNAVASVQCGYGNTAPLQLEVSPNLTDKDQLISVIQSMIRSHFKAGGTLININIMDKNVILDAYDHPDKYPDLVVRVTGFTAYFSVLNEEFRKMTVERVIAEA